MAKLVTECLFCLYREATDGEACDECQQMLKDQDEEWLTWCKAQDCVICGGSDPVYNKTCVNCLFDL